MKKTTVFVMSFIFALVSFLQLTATVQADSSYDITDYDMKVNVLKNGDANVIQKITYDFDGEFHGVYFNLDTRGIKGSGDPEISISQNGSTNRIQQAETNQNDSFQVTKTNVGKKFKVFHNVTDQKATFTYKYRLYGVVTNYLDTAQINWKVVGNNWDQDIEHAKIVIALPEKQITQLRAWTHGPLNGNTEVDHNDGRVIMTVDNLSDHQSVESRVIFPISVTASNTNVVSKNIKPQVLREEKSAADKANHQRAVNKALVYSLIPIFVLIVVIMFIWVIRTWIKNPDTKVDKPTPLNHWFEVPKMRPSMARLILRKDDKPDFMGLTGDLLDNVGRRELDIKQLDKTYEIEKTSKDADPFFEFLINDVGDGQKVTMKQIKDSQNENIYYQYNDWQKRMTVGRNKFFSAPNQKLLNKVRITSYSTLVLAFFFVITMTILMPSSFVMSFIIGVIAALSAITLRIYAQFNISEYTQVGAETANELQGFRRMLKDINDINVAEVGDLILWEQILPYAAAFGISKKVIDALKLKFGDQIVNEPMIGYYYYGLTNAVVAANFGQIINQSYDSFDNSLNSNFTDSSGFGGGGFTGGSSGGFGGGSGGGAF